MNRIVTPALLSLALSLVACGPADRDDDAPTYHRDVAPLMERNCVGCHQPGAIGPFALTTFKEVRAVGELVKFATETRSMPPNNVDASGECNEYADARWLTDDEIELIGRWVDDGMKEGAEADKATGDGVALSEPLSAQALSFAMEAEYTPRPSDEHPGDDYRCFMLGGAPSDVDQFMTGYEVAPGEPLVFHHMLLFAVTSEESQQLAAQRQNEDEFPGWECFGDGGIDDTQLLAVWAPGKKVTHYPEGTGIKVPAGSTFAMQVHYNVAAGELPDLSAVKIQLEDAVEKEAVLSVVSHEDFELLPGQQTFETNATFPLLGLPRLQVWGVFPHMHLLGRSLHVEVGEAFSDDYPPRCMVDVPDWKFEWQELNFFTEPMLVTPEEEVRISCTFDTRERTESVFFGDGTSDEMCLVFTYVTLEEGGPIDID